MSICSIYKNKLSLNLLVPNFTLTLLKQEQKPQQLVWCQTSGLYWSTNCQCPASQSYPLREATDLFLFAIIIPALQQESHFVLPEERRHPLLSLETADSRSVVYQLQ